MVKLRRAAEARQRIEETGHLAGEVIAAGEEAEVGVTAGGPVIVVPGAEVDVVPQGLGLAAHDEAALAMNLVADHAVDHVHARLLKLARPVDVVGLVKARLEFDQRRHLLAVARGLDERAHDE